MGKKRGLAKNPAVRVPGVERGVGSGTAIELAVMATPPAKFFSVLGRGYIHVSRAVRDLSGPYQLASGPQIPGKSPCQPVNLPVWEIEGCDLAAGSRSRT